MVEPLDLAFGFLAGGLSSFSSSPPFARVCAVLGNGESLGSFAEGSHKGPYVRWKTSLFYFGLVLVVVGLALLVFGVAKFIEYRNPPVGNFIEADSTKLHYLERGNGEPVVSLARQCNDAAGLYPE